MEEKIKLGIYEHYKKKGNLYRVIGVARHSETEEDMVVYEALYDVDIKLHVRPLAMFLSDVQFEGKIVPRFRFIRPTN